MSTDSAQEAAAAAAEKLAEAAAAAADGASSPGGEGDAAEALLGGEGDGDEWTFLTKAAVAVLVIIVCLIANKVSQQPVDGSVGMSGPSVSTRWRGLSFCWPMLAIDAYGTCYAYCVCLFL